MLFSQPRENIITQPNRKLVHLPRLSLGGDTCGLIPTDVAFLAEAIESVDFCSRPADRHCKALNCPIVMLFARGAETRRGEQRRDLFRAALVLDEPAIS